MRGGEMVLLSGACSASPIKIQPNTPMSLQRFQRLYSVFGGPYSAGASHHRKPLRLIKNNTTQDTTIINTRTAADALSVPHSANIDCSSYPPTIEDDESPQRDKLNQLMGHDPSLSATRTLFMDQDMDTASGPPFERRNCA
jgi:hypothetical protein